MIDVLFVEAKVILAATALMPSVMAVMNLAILHRTAPTRLLHQISFKALIHPQLKGHIKLLLFLRNRRHFINHSPATIPTARKAAV